MGRHSAPAPAPGRHRAKGFWASFWESFNTPDRPAKPKGRHRAKSPARPRPSGPGNARQQATSRPQSPMAARSRAYRNAEYSSQWAPGRQRRSRPQPVTSGPFGWWSR